MDDLTEFQAMCMEIGEFLAITGMMDAHLRNLFNIHPDENIAQVGMNWDERLQEVRAFLGKQKEEIIEFGSGWDV